MPASQSPRTSLSTIVRERWLAILLVVLAVLFVAQNRNRVDFNLFWIHLTMPLWFVLLAMLVVGAVVGFLAAGRRHR